VEAKILALQAHKRALFDSVFLGDQLELLVDDVERLCLRCCRRARAPTC
jgi:hypothetical protein